MILLAPMAAYSYVPFGNGAYVFDFRYDTEGHKKGHHPGLFIGQINEYNRAASKEHRITQLFIYAGDMEMYCLGSGGSRSDKPCKPDDLMIFYGNGSRSTKAYSESINTAENPVDIVAVVDGRVDTKGKNDYLHSLNTLSYKDAIIYADKVARLFCNDSRVSGVQFDIEPFDMNQKGQYYFFQQIAKDFAGKNHSTADDRNTIHCVDGDHPKGRYFSVFTNSYHIDAQVGQVLNQYQNGYVIDALYDLGSHDKGVATPPEEYRRLVNIEMIKILSIANQYHVKFQLAIPVAATEHEFESRAGHLSGYHQLDYIKAAFSAMNEKKVRENANFLGVVTWVFEERMMLGGHEYTPSKPDEKTGSYLMKNL